MSSSETAVLVVPGSSEKFDYKCLAHSWEARCRYVSERLIVWKEEALRLRQRVKEQEEQIDDLKVQHEKDVAQMAWLKKQIFATRSEQRRGNTSEASKADETPSVDELTNKDSRRPRGQQKKAPGHGRRLHPELPSIAVIHDVPLEERQCPRCKKPYERFVGSEDSEEIHWEVRIIRRVHQRLRYRAACDCEARARIVTAPGPCKLIPKGLFSVEFWVWLMVEKFLFQRPLNRVREVLALEGLTVSCGTLVGGLQKIAPLWLPVVEAIEAHSHQSDRRKMDETRWLVFIRQDGKRGHRWYLWVDVTPETVVYVLDPSRSARVVKDHLGVWEGILLVDCYAAYKTHQGWIQAQGLRLILAFCWSHRRRDFVEVGEGYPRLRLWAESWVEKINTLFAINGQRVAALGNRPLFDAADTRLRAAVEAMDQQLSDALAQEGMHPKQRQLLRCMRRHWEGLTVFVDHPEIPMDNNESERKLRGPAVGRKNYYGSGAVWSGQLCAHLFTILQTLILNHIDPKQWMSAYLGACAQNGGRCLESVGSWLPWNLTDEQRRLWRYPKTGP